MKTGQSLDVQAMTSHECSQEPLQVRFRSGKKKKEDHGPGRGQAFPCHRAIMFNNSEESKNSK